MACIGAGGAAYLRIVHGWHKLDAHLAASPGAMSQVLVMANEFGADLRAIAIVQSMRVVIIAVGLPAGLALFGFAGHASRPSSGPLTIAMLDELAILIAASAAGAIVANRLRMPGGLLFGAMLASAALHGTGLIHAIMPPWVANAAALALGAIVGARFANVPFRLLLNFLGAAFGTFAVAVTIAAAFGAMLVAVLSLNVAEVMIAFAPGSVDAMMLLALALHLDPVYVGAHHVTRIILVSLSIPFVARRASRPRTGQDMSGTPSKAPARVPPKPLAKRPPFQD
jgi:membrane AbrB-like protein